MPAFWPSSDAKDRLLLQFVANPSVDTPTASFPQPGVVRDLKLAPDGLHTFGNRTWLRILRLRGCAFLNPDPWTRRFLHLQVARFII
jgi:hypothetical protein